MKTERLNFQWFEKEDRRKPLRASLGRDGKLRLGEELRKKVPQTIRIGFNTRNRILAIADGHGSGITYPKSGNLNAKALCNEVYSAGIKLPVIFDFERDPETGFYLGKILMNVESENVDMDQLVALYQPAINMIIQKSYRSISAAERRAYAIEAFCKAAQEYDTVCGDFWDFAEKQIRERLATENKKRSAEYMTRSLDGEKEAGDGSVVLHNIISDSLSGGIRQVEEKIMHQQFVESLSDLEQKLYTLIRQGCYVEQIAMELSMDEEEIICMGRQIGQKRRAFYTAI